MSKTLKKRLEALEIPVYQVDPEAQKQLAETTELLRQYDALMTEERKLPIEEQQRREKEVNAQVVAWYVSTSRKVNLLSP